MKIRPIILCGGEGTRLWPNTKNNQAKQFINFGGWNLLEKTLQRIRGNLFDSPIISTNQKYLKEIKHFLKKSKIYKYDIILEPSKKNTGPAILCSALIKKIPSKQPLMILPADHLIQNISKINNMLKKNIKYLNNQNIFVFGIKPISPSNDYGYFITKKNNRLNKVIKFIEKPSVSRAKTIIKKRGYWNSGMFLARKDSIIKNFKTYQPSIYNNCIKSVINSKLKQNTHWLKKHILTI